MKLFSLRSLTCMFQSSDDFINFGSCYMYQVPKNGIAGKTTRCHTLVIYVGLLFPLSTVTFVMNISMKLLWGNISQMNLKDTELCHLKSGDLLPSVQYIPQKYLPDIVNDVILQPALCVFLRVNINARKRRIYPKWLITKKNSGKKLFTNNRKVHFP